MQFKADNCHDLVQSMTWTCLVDTPAHHQNPLFGRYFPSYQALKNAADAANITYAPGLFEALTSDTPPTVEFFKSLPTGPTDQFGDYALVLEKDGCPTLIYFGSGTGAMYGVFSRWRGYDKKQSLPRWVSDALSRGYKIVHKGLLSWCPIPTAALVPIQRLLFIANEATYGYGLWGMRDRCDDYGMKHICRWNIKKLEYGGLCGHCSLSDSIRGNFDLTAEELEALAVENKERMRKKTSDHYYRNMAENYSDFLDRMYEYRERYNEANPGRAVENQRKLRNKNVENKSF